MDKYSIGVSIVVAVAQNGVIGLENAMPWRLSTDLKRFKALTLGKPVIMGRKTWESIGRPLPGRTNIIITRDRDFVAEGAEIVYSLVQAIAVGKSCAQLAGVDEICILGGGEIYKQAMPLASMLHVTRVLADIEGDTRFPDISATDWRLVSEQNFPAGEKDSHATRYLVYEAI